MQTILDATELSYKVFGQQQVKDNCVYRKSIYLFPVKCDDGSLIYNTLTGEICLIPNEETEEDNKLDLIKKWFLVPESFDEIQQVRDYRYILKLMTPRKDYKNNFTIFTTTDCNARCYYCYELGIKRIKMTQKTAKDVADYISKECKGKEVKISWFGGEPLYNIEAIDTICNELIKKKVSYHSIMTSNGYYLDKESARKARDLWKVSRVQITIDGTRDVYNRVKAYINHDENAFERVIDNIQNVLDAGVKVTIRLNIDSSNSDDVLMLIDYLYARFGKRDDLDFAPTLLRDWAAPVHAFSSNEEKITKYKKIVNKLMTFGMVHDTPLYREVPINHCIADNDSCETIMPDGKIGKCDQFQGKDLVGSIYEDYKDIKMLQAWKEQVEFSECKKCSFFPNCYNLKKCNWVKDGCEVDYRRRIANSTERKVLNIYKDYLKANEKR